MSTMRATTGITTAIAIVVADVDFVDGGDVDCVCDAAVVVVVAAVLLIDIVKGADVCAGLLVVEVSRSVLS